MARPRSALGPVAAICYWAIKLLPVKVASEMMAKLTGSFPRFFLKVYAIQRNLQAAFPELDDEALDALTRRATANFGRLVAELVHIGKFRKNRGGTNVRATGSLDYTFKTRGPAIYVSGHVGNWELMPILFTRAGIPMHIIHTELGEPIIDRELMALRRKTGAVYVEKENALRACIAALSKKESIAFLVDQRVDSGIEVDFFGRPTLFTRFPARMAMRFNCPIIAGEAVRLSPGNVEVVYHPPIWPKEGDDPEEIERDLTQQMATFVEASIRRNPDQWFCTKIRWKKSKLKNGDADQAGAAVTG